MYFNGCTAKQTMLYPNNAILLSNQKEQTADTYTHTATWGKSPHWTIPFAIQSNKDRKQSRGLQGSGAGLEGVADCKGT